MHLHLPVMTVLLSEDDGVDGWSTTLWKSDTVRFVFGHLNYHTQIPIKDNGRSDAYGCVYMRSRSVPRAYYALTHTFGCIVYTPEGIKSARSIGKAVVGLNDGTGSRRYPRSFCFVGTRTYRTF